jgi:hypothetical protein
MKQYLEGAGLLAAMTLYLASAVGAHTQNHLTVSAFAIVSMLIGWTLAGWGATSLWRRSEARVASEQARQSLGQRASISE